MLRYIIISIFLVKPLDLTKKINERVFTSESIFLINIYIKKSLKNK
jgi:hypothetical protein